jgi:hypothetical protein
MSKIQLQKAIEAVNLRHERGLNDDDQVANMIATDRKTKGYTFRPRYDMYEICTDTDRFSDICERYGYWSDEVQRFNAVLQEKGGYEYMTTINNAWKEAQRTAIC